MAEFYSKEVMKHFYHPHNMGEIKKPDGVGEAGNPVCIPGKIKIQTNGAMQEIGKIGVNTKVLSCDGEYNRINKIFKRAYKGKMIKLKNRFGSIEITPEHKIFAIKIPKTYFFLLTKNRQKLKPKWYHAHELEVSDIVLYPKLLKTKNKRNMKINYRKLKYDLKSKSIPQEIKIDEGFLRLSGYYLAEGSLRDEVTKTYLTFTFDIKEEELANDVVKIVKRIFGVEAKKKYIPKRKTIVVEVNNVFVVRLFRELFNKGAKSKRIPHFMMLLPIEKQRGLIYGLWKGDGFVNLKIPRLGYSTISYELCQQMKTLLLRQGIIPSIYEEKEKRVDGVKHRKAYRIHVGDRKSVEKLSEILQVNIKINKEEANRAWQDGKFAYIPITEKRITNFDGFVYNLEVENAHSYATQAFTLHNCGDILRIYIKVKNNRIEKIKFQTMGCAAAISTSSMITDLAKGKTIEEAQKISRQDVADALSGLPPIKMHCSNLAADALHAAISDYLRKKR